MGQPRIHMDLPVSTTNTCCEGGQTVSTHHVESGRMLTAGSTYTNETTGAVIDYYEVEVKAATQQIYPNLPATTLYTYDGSSPGPTFMMRKGRGMSPLHPVYEVKADSVIRGSSAIYKHQSNKLISPCSRPVQPCSVRWLGRRLRIPWSIQRLLLSERTERSNDLVPCQSFSTALHLVARILTLNRTIPSARPVKMYTGGSLAFTS